MGKCRNEGLVFPYFFVTKIMGVTNYLTRHMRMVNHISSINQISNTGKNSLVATILISNLMSGKSMSDKYTNAIILFRFKSFLFSHFMFRISVFSISKKISSKLSILISLLNSIMQSSEISSASLY